MAKRQMDDEANLKRQARRRLIGAVALVTAVVVILPMVLEREPKPGGQDIDLRIPDPDKAGEFKSKLELPAEVASAPVSAPPAASPVANPAAVVEKPAVPAAALPAASAPQPSKPQTETKAQPEAKTQTTPQPKVEPQPKAQPVAEHVTKKPAEQTVAKPAAKPHAVPKQGFVVQVGAFSKAATAEQLQQKLHKLGFHAYTEKVGGNVRVRVGPYASRSAAQKDLNRLKAQGMHPVLAKLD